MKTILDILRKAGGWDPGLWIRIDNAPYMDLVIEATGEPGPHGLLALSVAYYGLQNGDAMRDPEMCFEIGFLSGPDLNPFYFPQRLRRRRTVEPHRDPRPVQTSGRVA